MIEETQVPVEKVEMEKRFVVTLTSDELVALGILSYLHEAVAPNSVGTFFRSLPEKIQGRVEREANANRGGFSSGDNVTFQNLEISWRKS